MISNVSFLGNGIFGPSLLSHPVSDTSEIMQQIFVRMGELDSEPAHAQ